MMRIPTIMTDVQQTSDGEDSDGVDSARPDRRRCATAWPDTACPTDQRRRHPGRRACGRKRSGSARIMRWRWGCGRPGNYEAQLLAAMLGEPERLTPAQMDAWCRDFDNWGTVDTACFTLFDRSPHALEDGAEVGEGEGRVPEAGRLRDDGVPRRPRQDREGRGVPEVPPDHREGRDRRSQLRQEGRQLGAARTSAIATPRSTRPPSRPRRSCRRATMRPSDGSARTRCETSRARRVKKAARR